MVVHDGLTAPAMAITTIAVALIAKGRIHGCWASALKSTEEYAAHAATADSLETRLMSWHVIVLCVVTRVTGTDALRDNM